MIWWIPDEFWEQTLKDNPTVPAAGRKELLLIVSQYLVFAVVEGTIDPLGEFNAESREALVGKMSIKVGEKELQPLDEDDLTFAAKNFFQTMKPLLGRTVGKIGQSMEFIVFEGRDRQDQRYADPLKKGQLITKFGPKEFKWRLPLGSLLPPKYDAATGEQFPGNFDFSPYTGAKLSIDKPAKE
jgi:hypothetical protein